MIEIFSKDDSDEVVEAQGSKLCVLCKKPFVPKGRNKSRQKICNRQHFRKCEVCGKVFEITDVSGGINYVKKTCSKECSNALKYKNLKASVKEKYGVENISQDRKTREKAISSIKSKSSQIQSNCG